LALDSLYWLLRTKLRRQSERGKRMSRVSGYLLCPLVIVLASPAWAGGSNYSVAPGTRVLSGKITEWPVPTPKYVRDPVVAADGSIFIAVRDGDRIARFDPRTQRFQEWKLRDGFKPTGMRIDADGKVLFTSIGFGVIGELDPSSGRIREFNTTAADSRPYAIVLDPDGRSAWFTERATGNVVRLQRPGGKLTPYQVGKEPYGLAVERNGNVWVARLEADKLTRLDPKTGATVDISFATGTIPRRLALGPDGVLWLTYFGTGKLAKVDTLANRVVKEYALPGGPNSGPYGVNVDGAGRVWVSEIQTDNVDVFDPRSETFKVFKLPNRGAGIRKAVIDADGRYWYSASHAGKLGVIE
jgi:virginiamycin B lyase